MGTIGLMADSALEGECAAWFGRQYALAVGRGTWALALILKAIEKQVRRRILALPSFLCQTPLAAIHYVGWQPLFCDVDPATGLVPDAEWAKAVEMGAGAALLVHLFGNPADPAFATELCRQSKVFLIEDACQAVGGTLGERVCGSFGNAAIVSFGHTKTIDAGSGGLLLTDEPEIVAAAADIASRQPYLSPQRYDSLSKEASWLFYDRKDRLLAEGSDPADILSGVIDAWIELVPAAWSADAAEISRQLGRLPKMAAERRRKSALYAGLLAETAIEPLQMGPGAVPWRFCFRVPGIDRKRQEALSATLRAKAVHISNWYVPTHWMAQRPYLRTGSLDGTLQLHSEIFQLWLDQDTDDARIRTDASALKEVLAA